MSKAQYLIVGANFINKGAEAMLKTVQMEVLKRHPDAEIYAICHAEEKEIAKRQNIRPVYDTTNAFIKKVRSLLKRILSKVRTLLGKPPIPYADVSPMETIVKLSNLKLAIDVSGFAYGDKRGYQQPVETMKIMKFCKSIGAGYIFMPQAWGSFKDKLVAANCRKMINQATAWFTRDEVSQKYVAELLGKPINEVPLLPDIAFHFPIPNLDGMTILKQHGFPEVASREIVCISPNMRVYERMPGSGSANSYVRSFLEVIHELKQRFDVVLIPNEILPDPSMGRDDQFLCKTIFNALDDKTNVYCISGYYSAEEIKSVIRACSLVIASRFHSLVFALSLGIPCIAISWSHKYRELFKLFDLTNFVLEDKEVGSAQILSAFNDLYEQKEAVRKKIMDTLPVLKERNKHVFELFN
jgi:colanic acid/amylovoran biosynthesis protein